MACREKGFQDLDKYRDTMRKQKERYRNRNGACAYGKRPYSMEED